MIDLEPILATVAPTLRSGELIADDAFALFDAMSALEVGDAKMDAGARAQRDALTLDDVIARDRAPLNVSNDDELIRVCDELLACEGAFHEGHASATTTLSNAYVAARERFDERGVEVNEVLRAIVKANVSSAWTVKHVVRLGDVYEEEDFVMQDFGEREAAHAGASAAEDEVIECIDVALKALAEDANAHASVREALRARLEFRLGYHEMMKTAVRAVGSGEAGVAKACAKHGSRAKACLTIMREYYGDDGDDETLDWNPDAGSFSREMSLYRLGGAPPRDVNFMSRRRAFKFFEKEIDDVIAAAEVFEFRARNTAPTIDEIMSAMESLQKRRPGTLALSLAAAELLKDKNICGHACGVVVLRSVWEFVGKEVPKLSPAAEATFWEECEQPVSILIRSFCVNRARFRRVLRRILGELGHLQLACDALDNAHDFSALNDEPFMRGFSAPHIAWAESLTAYVQRRHIELGFSLDLYLPHELPMLYYYIGHLQQITMVTMKRRALMASLNERVEAQYRLAAEQIKMSMYLGLRFMFLALEEHGKIRKCETKFSGEDLRFWQRFGTFQSVELPPALLYGDYLASIDDNIEHFAESGPAGETRTQMFARCAQTFLAEVRAVGSFFMLNNPSNTPASELVRLEHAAEAAAAQKIAAKNSIALKLLLATDMACSVDFSEHDIFVVAHAQKASV